MSSKTNIFGLTRPITMQIITMYAIPLGVIYGNLRARYMERQLPKWKKLKKERIEKERMEEINELKERLRVYESTEHIDPEHWEGDYEKLLDLKESDVGKRWINFIDTLN